MHPFVRIFMIIWFGGVALFAMVFIAAGWNALACKSDGSRQVLLGIVISLAMFAFGIGLVRFGRYLARSEGRILIDFLTQTLDARSKEIPRGSRLWTV